MQRKRSKRSRNRASKITAGHGSKKKNRGAGHRGGRGKSGAGKRGDAKLMKITGGIRNLGKQGFTSQTKPMKIINLKTLQTKLDMLLAEGKIEKKKEIYEINLDKFGYDKLLSKGSVTEKMRISVKNASKRAIDKVTSSGGEIVLLKKSED